mgnify:CR=1 FL=1
MQTALAAGIAFIITAVSGYWLVPALKKLHYGQTILEIGPSWHKGKEGTPTMGGVMFIAGITVAAGVVWFMFSGEASSPDKVRFAAGVLMALAYGIVGFIDDYVKVVMRRNLGLSAKQKFTLQLLIAAVYVLTLALSGSVSTSLAIPFVGQLECGWLYYPIAVFIVVGTVNAVNLTDGIDGLCSCVTFVFAVGFIFIATALSYSGMTSLAAALAGGAAGFMVWNAHPAKVFMGDTGSLFLGGVCVALAFGVGFPVVLVFSGIVYMLETLSDIIQIGNYKLTHRRIFKMAPIHHHFEMCGWSEWKIVIVFSLVGAAGSVLALLAARQL